MPHRKETGDTVPVTQPTPLADLPRQVRIDGELAIVRAHHERIAKAIEMFWGHPECENYIQQLIISGGDRSDQTREGFKSEVISALISLAALHETK